MKRREFLFGSAAFALGATLASQLPVRADEVKTGIKLGLTTYMIGSKWTLPQLIQHLTQLEIFGLELRTDEKFAHGIELDIDKTRRNEVKKRMADSPVTLVGIASGERFDSPNPGVLKKSIERTKELLQFCADLGASGLRVFPNDFQKDVPQEKTLDQIATSLKALAPTAESLNVEIRLEAHGNAGLLPNLAAIAKNVDHPKVRIMLNSDLRDTQGEGLLANLQKTEQYLAEVIHLHELLDQKHLETKYYETQLAFLKSIEWNGWCLLEIGDQPNDETRLAELSRQQKRWNELLLGLEAK
jgi:sugar phosphate isomerase/epimerase